MILFQRWSFKIFDGFNFQKRKRKKRKRSQFLHQYKFICDTNSFSWLMLITSTFRIYLFQSIVRLAAMPRDATKQNRSLREIYVNPREKKGEKEREKVIPNPKLTYTLSKGLVVVPTNPFSQLIITLTDEIFPPREKDPAACNHLPYVHIVWGQRTAETWREG